MRTPTDRLTPCEVTTMTPTEPSRTEPLDAIDSEAPPPDRAASRPGHRGGRAVALAAAGATGAALAGGGWTARPRWPPPPVRPPRGTATRRTRTAGRRAARPPPARGPGERCTASSSCPTRRRLPHDADPARHREQGQRHVDHRAQRGRLQPRPTPSPPTPASVRPRRCRAASRTAPTSWWSPSRRAGTPPRCRWPTWTRWGRASVRRPRPGAEGGRAGPAPDGQRRGQRLRRLTG